MIRFVSVLSIPSIRSLVNHPLLMTHASGPDEMRRCLGITPDLVRFSVGIEDPKDLHIGPPPS